MKPLSRSLALVIVLAISGNSPLLAQRNPTMMYPLSVSGVAASALPAFETGPSQQPGQITLSPALHIEIIDGEGAINNIRGRIATDIIVQVQDRDHRPVAGAVVTLLSPSGGPSGTFAGGQHLVSLSTGRDGRAVLQGFHANKIAGKFQVKVTASFHGEVATTTITQTNLALAAGAAAGGAAAGGTAAGAGVSAGAIGAIAAGIAAAVGVGVGVYVTHTGHSSTPTISIGQPGSVTAGAPPH